MAKSYAKSIKKIFKINNTIEVNNTVEPTIEDEKFALKRVIGLWGAVACLVGTMIGSGIFVSPKSVVSGSQSVGVSLTVWSLCGLIALAGTLSYAEIALLIQKSGGQYTFLLEVFGPAVAFMEMTASVFLQSPASTATNCIACASYILTIFFGDNCKSLPHNIEVLLAVIICSVITTINVWSVRFAVKTQVAFTAIKLAALSFICIGGIYRLSQGHVQNFSNAFAGSSNDAGDIVLAFYGGMWAYSGWNIIMTIVEEVKNPNRNIPLAAVLSIVIVTFVYVLVNISYFTVMSPTELLASPAVASTWIVAINSQFAWMMLLMVAMSVFGNLNITLLVKGRGIFVPACEGHIPQILSMIHTSRYTPAPAVIFTGFLAIIYIFVGGSIQVLLRWTLFSRWLTHGMVMFAVIYMRLSPKWKNKHRPYKAPIVCPVFVFLISLYFVSVPIIYKPDWGYIYAILLMVGSLAAYVPFVKYRLSIPGIDHVTKFFQLFLQVAPEDKSSSSL